MATGWLTDASAQGIGGKTITFDGSGADNLTYKIQLLRLMALLSQLAKLQTPLRQTRLFKLTLHEMNCTTQRILR